MAELDKPGALFEKFFDNPARRASAKKADETYGSDLIGEYDRIKQSRERLNYLTTERANTLANLPNISPPKPSITSDLMGGNAMTGPDPERRADQFSNLEYTKQLASKTQDIADSNQNPYAWAKPYTFNTGINNADFDRYYTHPLYNELGYSPFRDNEALYNEKATWTDDFNRMRKQWLGLALEGVKSMWGSADSKDFERRNKIAQSSKGGVGGFVNNLLLNSSYTVGVATDLIVEELALSAGITATGGLASEIMIPQMAATAARAAKLFGTAKSFSKTRDMLNIMKGAKARTFLNETKAAKTVGNIADYLNPLRYSTRAAYGLATGAKGYKGLTALAQVSTGTGAFLRDMVRLRAAYGESKLEGDGLQIRFTNDKIGEYYAKNGKMPEGGDAEKIYSIARETNFKSQLYNMPLLLVTNDMVFGKAFRGFSPKWVGRAESLSARGIIRTTDKAGKTAFKKSPEGVKKFLDANYWKQSPTKIALGAMTYGKANFFEGAQETMQEIISNGIENYYTKIYHDPLLTGSQQYWASMKYGTASQLNGQGFETFLSGFLMGGLLQVPQNLVMGVKERYTKKGVSDKKNRDEQTERIVTALNEVIMNTGKISSAIEENMINQKNLSNDMRDSENRNDRKGYQDAKNASMYGHVRTLLENDQYDIFMESLEDMTEWSDAELAEAFNTTTDADINNKSVRERLNSVIEEAQTIKDIHESFGNNFADPSDMGAYNKETHPEEWRKEAFKKQAYNDIRYHAAFGFYTFKKTQSRMTSIINDVGGDKMPLQNTSSDDITSLFDPQQRGDKIRSLVDEVKSYENASPAEKKKGKKIENQVRDYDALAEAIGVYEHLFDEIKPPLIGPLSEEDTNILANEAAVTDNLKKAYFKYVKTLAKNNDVAMLDEQVYPSLNGLMDYLQLSKEHKRIAESINFLHDPTNFITSTIRQGEFLQKIYDKQAEIASENMKTFEGWTGENKEIFNNIFDLGLYLPPSSLEAFKERRDSDIIFFYANDPEKKLDLIKDKKLYDKGMALIVNYRETTTPVEALITAESVATKIINEEELTVEEEEFRDNNATAMATALAKVKPKANSVDDAKKIMFTNATPIGDMDPDLVTALTEAHSDWNAKADTEDQVTLEHYIKNFEAAALIIVAYNDKVGRTVVPTKKVPSLPPIISGKPDVTETVNLEEKKQEAIKNIVKDDSKVDYDVPVIHRADPIWYTTVDGKDIEASSKEELLKKIDIALGTASRNTISNGDKIIDVQTKPITDEITDTKELFLTAEKKSESRVFINMAPLKNVLVVPNNTHTVVDNKTGKEVVNQELNPEGSVIFEAMQGRLFVVANINGQLVPFYKSSAGTSGKKQGAWYPFFGYTGAWLVKGAVNKTTGEMSYSPEIDRITKLLNENLVFPDQYINRKTNTVSDSKGKEVFNFNSLFKINRLWQKTFKSQTGKKFNYSVKGLKENTTAESALVALITGLNTTELDSSRTPKELSEWVSLINKNITLKKAPTAPAGPTPKAGIVRKLKSEFKGKIIYGTPGIGKTTSVAHNPDLVDGDDLLLKYLNLLEEEEGQALTKPTDNIGAALFEVPQDYDDGYSKLDAIYDKAIEEAEALATAGRTVLFGSSRLVSNLALLKGRGVAVFSTTNDRMVGKGLSEESMVRVRDNETIGRKVAEVHPDFKVYTSDNISDLIFEEEALQAPKEERSVLDDINEASTIEEIDEIANKVDDTDAGYFVRRNIDHTNVLKKIEEKRIEIAGSVIIAKLKKGQEFLMKDLKFYGKKGWGVVTKVTRTNVSIAKKGDPGKVTIYKKSELNDKVWQQITLEMKPIQQQKIEFDETTEKLSDESVKENREMTAEEKKKIIEKAKNTPMEDLKKNMFKKRC